MINRVTKDFKRLEGMIGERMQKLFDRLNWNTTFIIENLAGVYFAENDSYNGNIGLLERNMIDLYFSPNSLNVLTRKIGLSKPASSEQVLLMQILDPPTASGKREKFEKEISS